MYPILSGEEVEAIERSLVGEEGRALLHLVQALAQNADPGVVPAGALSCARRLGWISISNRGTPRLTEVGWKVADPVREYCLWLGRARRLPLENDCPVMRRESFRGQRILEIGSGYGCNLFSLDAAAAASVGLELDPFYLQFTSIFARRERLTPPLIVNGAAEQMPFSDARFDVVLATGAVQYMDLRRAVGEAARVLKPGGRFISIASFLGPFLRHSLTSTKTRSSARNVARTLLTAVDSWSYMTFGRRLRVNRSIFTTKVPVYPSHRFLCRTLRGAGLTLDERETMHVRHETCVVAYKTSR